VEVAAIIMVIPLSMLCITASMYLYKRNERERRHHLHHLAKDYSDQWQEFETVHKERFEGDYWNNTTRRSQEFEEGTYGS